MRDVVEEEDACWVVGGICFGLAGVQRLAVCLVGALIFVDQVFRSVAIDVAAHVAALAFVMLPCVGHDAVVALLHLYDVVGIVDELAYGSLVLVAERAILGIAEIRFCQVILQSAHESGILHVFCQCGVALYLESEVGGTVGGQTLCRVRVV